MHDDYEARSLYFAHHSMLCDDRGDFLCTGPVGGRVYRVIHAGRAYYPVRRLERSTGRDLTVTYLTADMVLANMLEEGPWDK